jgi:phosphatidylglycerol:prolipoprotein diacylglycerol transferase
MFPTIHIGSLSFQTPGLILIFAFWLGMTLAEHFSPRYNVPADKLTNLIFYSLLSGFIGARVTYIARFPSAFIESPASMISLNPAMLDLFGGFAFACIVALIYCQRNKLTFWATLDALSTLFAVMMIGIGLSHLASGTAFGAESSVPWAIELWGAKRHPSQIYEIIASFITLLFLLSRRDKSSTPGLQFLKFIALSSGWILFLEGFRGDSVLLPGNFRSIQVYGWIILASALFGAEIMKRKFGKKSP